MKKIQERKINPLPTGARISIFDKTKNRQAFIDKESNGPQKQVVVNSPQFRINQHKGA